MLPQPHLGGQVSGASALKGVRVSLLRCITAMAVLGLAFVSQGCDLFTPPPREPGLQLTCQCECQDSCHTPYFEPILAYDPITDTIYARSWILTGCIRPDGSVT